MRKFAAAFAALLLVVGGVVVTLVSGNSSEAAKGKRPSALFNVRPKEDIHERQGADGEIEADAASTEAFDDRAYPLGYITTDRSLASRQSYFSRPVASSAATRRAATRAALTSSWTELGPFDPIVPAGVTYTGVDTLNSGRVTAMAIDPNCGTPHLGCRLWVAAAGGGVWRTEDALAPSPVWQSTSTGLDSFATGSIVVDPNDPSGDTLYLGTGEPNGSTDSEAGVGLYKTTDGGDHWTLVPGSVPVANERSIGSIAIDPTNPKHIFIGTDLARHGHSSTYGGRRTPPNAPQLGLYESTDGGATFKLAFSRPESSNPPDQGTGSDFFQGGINEVRVDPTDPKTVYVAAFGYGIFRRSKALDGSAGFRKVFATLDATDLFGDRTEFAIAPLGNGHERMYVGDSSDENGVSVLWRTDQVDQPAASLASGASNLAPWIQLSDPTNGTPGFTSYDYCQDQCGYDDPVVVDPDNPDTVWLAGQMAYGEIPGAEGGTPRSFGRAVVRSTDAGVTFTDMTEDGENEGLHPDNHFIVMDPFNPDWAFVGSDGGVARIDGHYEDRSDECDSRNLGADDLADCKRFLSSTPVQIDAINNGLATLQFQDITFNPNNPTGDLAGGTQDNGTWTSAGAWVESIGGDGGPSSIGIDGVHMHTYTDTTGDVNFHGTDPDTWDYDTWPMDISGELDGFYSPLVADPTVAGTVFAGMQHIWRTQDNGGDQAQLDQHCRDNDPLSNLPIGDRSIVCGDWVPLGPDLTDPSFGSRDGQFVSQIKRAPSNNGTLWASTRFGRLFVSTNANAADPSAVKFDRIDTDSTPGRFVSGIVVDPSDPNHAWVSYSGYSAYTPGTPGHVFEVHYHPGTHNATFADRSYDLGDQPITDVEYDPSTGDLYAGTDFGVERLESGKTSWERAANGLPPVSVYGLSLASGARVLYAATHGRGIYSLALPAGGAGGSGSGGSTTGSGSAPTTTDQSGSAPATAPSSPTVTTTAPSSTPARLVIAHVSAVRRARYVAVHFGISADATLVIRVRDEHGRVVATRTVHAKAGSLAYKLALRRGTKVHHHRMWTVTVTVRNAGAASAAHVRFRV